MPYIGKGLESNTNRKRFIYTATASQTSFSGTDDSSLTLGYDDTLYMDVYQNGVLLVPATDYAATTGTSVVLEQGASVGDTVEMVVYDVVLVGDTVSASAGGTFSGGMSFASDVSFAAGADIITASEGTSNFRAGVNAGNSIVSGGNFNTVVGDEAGTAITTGDLNVAVGYLTGDAINTGERNVLAGHSTGGALTTGSSNTAIGDRALLTDTKGLDSVALGRNALFTQNFTTATSSHNIAIGRDAGASISTGVENVIIGSLAGDSLSDADFNVAVGKGALGNDQLGSRNTAVGNSALQTQQFTTATNSYNAAFGFIAGGAISTGLQNTCIGAQAGDGVNTGNNNTIIGNNSGSGAVLLADGDENVIIGSNTHTTAVNTDGANVIGYNVAGAAGYTTLGKAGDDIRAAHGNVSWATVSDQRYKKDIVNSTAGLSFINALKPRTFKYKNLGELPETFRAYEADSTDVFKNSDTNHGFIAQEVKAAIDAHSELKDGFKLWDERDDGGQEVAESALIPILVKAIQELSAKNDALATRIKTLEDA